MPPRRDNSPNARELAVTHFLDVRGVALQLLAQHAFLADGAADDRKDRHHHGVSSLKLRQLGAILGGQYVAKEMVCGNRRW